MPKFRRCVNGAAAACRSSTGGRCVQPAVAGFDYCDECSSRLGGFLMQLPPGDPDRAAMHHERAADCAAARRADRSSKATPRSPRRSKS